MGTLTRMGPLTLEHIAMEARPYPVKHLKGCKTGLVLFAAAFMGHNDAIHFAEAGIDTTCVDINGPRLREMAGLYPDGWSFVTEDAWKVAEKARKYGTKWDAVSVDTFTGDMMERSLDSLDLWCSLARKVVTVTYAMKTDGLGLGIGSFDFPEEVPAGWKWHLHPRSGAVYWLVLTRD